MSTADDAWQEWSDANPDVHDGDTWPHRAFMAGYRRALDDAADDLDARYRNGAGAYSRHIRDLAAEVGTKDGADDE